MVDAHRRRRRNELVALGVTISASVSDPAKLEKTLRKGIPDLEAPARDRVGGSDKPWWKTAEEGPVV